MKPKIVSPEEVSARTGIDVNLLKQVHAGINQMLNDKELKAKVDAQFYSGKIADIAGFEWDDAAAFEWDMDAEKPDASQE